MQQDVGRLAARAGRIIKLHRHARLLNRSWPCVEVVHVGIVGAVDSSFDGVALLSSARQSLRRRRWPATWLGVLDVERYVLIRRGRLLLAAGRSGRAPRKPRCDDQSSISHRCNSLPLGCFPCVVKQVLLPFKAFRTASSVCPSPVKAKLPGSTRRCPPSRRANGDGPGFVECSPVAVMTRRPFASPSGGAVAAVGPAALSAAGIAVTGGGHGSRSPTRPAAALPREDSVRWHASAREGSPRRHWSATASRAPQAHQPGPSCPSTSRAARTS